MFFCYFGKPLLVQVVSDMQYAFQEKRVSWKQQRVRNTRHVCLVTLVCSLGCYEVEAARSAARDRQLGKIQGSQLLVLVAYLNHQARNRGIAALRINSLLTYVGFLIAWLYRLLVCSRSLDCLLGNRMLKVTCAFRFARYPGFMIGFPKWCPHKDF